MQGPSEGGVYKCRSSIPTANTASTTTPSLDDWYVRLGHPNVHKLKDLASQQHMHFSESALSPCPSCRLGKLAQTPLVSRTHSSTKPFQLVFSDVWGPTPVQSSLGHK
jgi:hypothetical protein